MENYYNILGVNKNATSEEIKKAYRQKSKETHPDLNQADPNADQNFKKVTEAYETLSDNNKRMEYDNPTPQFRYDSFNVNDLFSQFYRSSNIKKERQIVGSDIHVELTLSFSESVSGTKKNIQINRMDKCEICNGTGAQNSSKTCQCEECQGAGVKRQTINTILGITTNITTCSKCNGKGNYIENPCLNCNGKGIVLENKTLEVNIPAGIEHGQQIILREAGNAGENNGPSGSLIIFIKVQSNSNFVRMGADSIYKCPITFTQAVLGDIIQIKTMYDTLINVQIPAGTKYNDICKIKELGFYNPKDVNCPRGNFNIVFEIQTPTNLTNDQKQALLAFDNTMK